MSRLLLGRNQGAFGLFISKPGVQVENVAPGDPNLFFSSQWGQVVSIVASGTTTLGATVNLPAVGFRPYIRLETKNGNSYNLTPPVGRTVSVGTNQNRRYDFTRYRTTYLSDTSFQVIRTDPNADNVGGDDGITFRYVAFNFAYNS